MNGENVGMLGRPMDLLDDVSSKCTTGDSRCIQLGKRACDTLSSCWGFAIHSGWGVQIYDNKALNQSVCTGVNGLMQNRDWDTYRKIQCGITLILKNYYFLLNSLKIIFL